MNKDEYIAGMLERTRLFYDDKRLEKVRNTVTAISGLGGVGAITAELLARWGIRRFRLLDKDRYDPSNLNRQLFATSKTLGRYKVEVAAERIREINPYAEIELEIKEPVDNQNVHQFVKGAGVVIQTADSPSCLLFYRAARKHRVPIVNGYSTIIGCRVQAYDYRKDSWWFKLEDIRDRVKWKGGKDITEMSREELDDLNGRVMHPAMPTMNFVTNIAGAMIVCEAIKILTDTGKPVLFPRVVELDLYKNRMRVKNPYSPFQKELWKKILMRSEPKEHFKMVIENAKKHGSVI